MCTSVVSGDEREIPPTVERVAPDHRPELEAAVTVLDDDHREDLLDVECPYDEDPEDVLP